MSLMEDVVVGAAIDKTEDSLENGGQEPKKKDNMFVRFIITLLWFVIAVVINVVALGLGAVGIFRDLLAALQTGIFQDSRVLEISGIILSGIYALVTFIVPYLRRKGTFTRWFGIVAVGDVLWYIYLILFNVQ